MSIRRIFIITSSSINNTITNLLWISKFNFQNNDIFIVLNFEKYSKKEIIPIKQCYKNNLNNNYTLFIDSQNIFSKIINFLIL